MLRLALLLPLFSWPPHALASEAAGSKHSAPLEGLARKVIRTGSPSRVAAPIAKLVDLPADAPLHYIEVSPNQASDGMYHLFQVLVELTEDRRPNAVGFLLMTTRAENSNTEDHVFRATPDGKLERAVVMHGRNDESGKSVKGSGVVTELEIASPEIKERFQHELDLFLKRRYLKKEWRSADFSNGVLVKKGKAQ